MKIKLKLISHFAVIVIACGGGLCFSASIHAQSTPPSRAQTMPDPNANKKEAPDAPPTAASKSMMAPSAVPTPSAKDKSFMEAAAKGGMMEVEMGHMAIKQGKSDDVKAI